MVKCAKYHQHRNKTIDFVESGGTAFLGGHKYQSPADLRRPEVKIALVSEFHWYTDDVHLDHDVAVCKLNKKIETTKTIGYAQLTSLPKWEGTGQGLLMGFGETFEGDTAHELRSGLITLECGNTCAPYVTTYRLAENALCGYNATSMFVMCWGDMGGAVADENGVLIAIIAYKQMKTPTYRLCSQPAAHTFFMFMGYYREWINSIVNPISSQMEEI